MGYVFAGSLLIVAAGLAGCGGGTDGTRADQAQTPTELPQAVAEAKATSAVVDPVITRADNAFGLSALQTLESQDGSSNIAISPLSLSLALQVLYNGARGGTQFQTGGVLQLGSLTTQQLNDDNAALQASLIDADPQVQLRIANSLWVRSGEKSILPSFIQVNRTYYGATIGDLAGAPDNVNAWVAQETDGFVPSILSPGDYSSAKAIIANAIYFKGPWTVPFDPNSTRPQTFTLEDGTSREVQMMQESSTFGYVHGAGFQMIRLPYADGHFSMIVLLPDTGTSLSSLIAAITAEQLDVSVGQLQGTYGSVALPRFTANSVTDMRGILETLGMSAAFVCNPGLSGGAYGLPAVADFSGLSADDLCLLGVAHDAHVEVNEAGTIATAATAVTVGITAIQRPLFTMAMDHPFLYLIRNDDSGLLLFIGTVMDPSK